MGLMGPTDTVPGCPPEVRDIDGLIEQVRFMRRYIKRLRADLASEQGRHRETRAKYLHLQELYQREF